MIKMHFQYYTNTIPPLSPPRYRPKPSHYSPSNSPCCPAQLSNSSNTYSSSHAALLADLSPSGSICCYSENMWCMLDVEPFRTEYTVSDDMSLVLLKVWCWLVVGWV